MMSAQANKHLIRIALSFFVSGVFLFSVYQSEAGQKEIKVAVATNFIQTMDEFADRYEKKTDTLVKRSSSATGILYSQIANGAPFDLFLAADQERPKLLHQHGFCEEPFTYATGRVVMWSSREDLDETKSWRRIILQDGIFRIAMANPETAPYGEAALEALKKAGIREKLQKRLVYGQNVGQAFQYGQQGVADVTFVALSFALSEHGRKGKTWLLPEAPPVVQKGCILQKTANKESVHNFIAYLQTDKAKNILSEFGYE